MGMTLLVGLGLLSLLIPAGRFDAPDGNAVYCVPTYEVELKESLTIQCSISGDHGYIYWLRGTDTSVVPFIWLEKDVGGEGLGEYNMTDDGALVISSASLHHEGVYTTVVYIDGFKYEATTEVRVTITPEPPCPSISTCPLNCEECYLEGNKTGEILCSVAGIRPKADIAWEVLYQPGVSTNIGQPEYKKNEDAGTWNASITITYDVDICDGYVVFNCTLLNAIDLQKTTRGARLYVNDACTPTSLETGPLVIVLIITGLMILVIFLILILWRSWCPMQNEDGHRYRDVPLESRSSDSMGSRPKARKVGTKQLISSLSEHYKKFLYVKPLPWGEAVEITNLYTSCDCEIRYENGGTATATSEDLFNEKFLSDNKRVLIVADLGFGKTTFAQHTMARWLSLKDGSIFVHVPLKDVGKNTELSDIIRNMLPVSSLISCLDIEDILSKNKCHILLDGLNELGMSEVKQDDKQSTNDTVACNNRLMEKCTDDIETGKKGNRSRLTVNSLLQNDIPRDSFQDIRLWVTSRELDEGKNPIVLPFAGVTFSGFNDAQVKEYITKTCQYYSGLRGSQAVDVHESNKLIPSDSKKVHMMANRENTSDNIDIDDESREEDVIEDLVKECLDLNEIVHDFVYTPLLLSMVINIITLKISQPDGPMKNINVNKLTTIVRMIITCLECRHFQKMGRESEQHEIIGVENALGRVAFKQKMGVDVMAREEWDKLISKQHVDTALAIGLLKQSKDFGEGIVQFTKLVTSSHTSIQFYHQYFQEYLAAQHVPSDKREKKEFDQILRDCNDDKTLRFFQFMTCSDHARVEEVMNKLYESEKMWNNLIDCMFEDEDITRVRRLLEKISKESRNAIINVLNLDRLHHQVTLRHFCYQCRDFNIPIHMMTFREDCSISFLGSCELPSLNRLVFYQMDITEDKFIRIMEAISKQIDPPKLIQFVKCSTPDTFSDSCKGRIVTATKAISKKMEVSKKKSGKQAGKDDIFIKKLNLEKVEWQRKWLPSGE